MSIFWNIGEHVFKFSAAPSDFPDAAHVLPGELWEDRVGLLCLTRRGLPQGTLRVGPLRRTLRSRSHGKRWDLFFETIQDGNWRKIGKAVESDFFRFVFFLSFLFEINDYYKMCFKDMRNKNLILSRSIQASHGLLICKIQHLFRNAAASDGSAPDYENRLGTRRHRHRELLNSRQNLQAHSTSLQTCPSRLSKEYETGGKCSFPPTWFSRMTVEWRKSIRKMRTFSDISVLYLSCAQSA